MTLWAVSSLVTLRSRRVSLDLCGVRWRLFSASATGRVNVQEVYKIIELRVADLLLRLGIEASTSLPLLLHQLAKTGQDEFAVFLDLFVCERAERIEEYSCGSFVGLGGSSECDLKFSLGHV